MPLNVPPRRAVVPPHPGALMGPGLDFKSEEKSYRGQLGFIFWTPKRGPMSPVSRGVQENVYVPDLHSDLKSETLEKLLLFCVGAFCPPGGCLTLKYSAGVGMNPVHSSLSVTLSPLL